MPRKIIQVKARIAANSPAIGKIRNAELNSSARKAALHELIRDPLA